jgi:Flp pilus assembly CpaE family ATPase
MANITVAVLTEDREQFATLRRVLESTRAASLVFSHVGFPVSATDPVVRQIQDQRAEVVMIELSPDDPQRAIRAIELVQDTTSEIAIFAIGGMGNARHVVAAMRAGACEFLDRATLTDALVEALDRFSVSRSRNRSRNCKARTFTVINAKGGAGATTLAVNLATALQKNHGQIPSTFRLHGRLEGRSETRLAAQAGNCFVFFAENCVGGAHLISAHVAFLGNRIQSR